MTRAAEPPLLEVTNLSVHLSRGRRLPLKAVDDVSFTVAERETVGVVGESGAGKSTIGRAILGLVGITGGTITFAGADITNAGQRQRRELSRELQVVFQDPYSSLNPTRSIAQTLGEPLRVLRDLPAASVRERVERMLERVGLPAGAADRYPVQFSGGQRQRIAIARALMIEPRLIVCDEPVTALDVSVQAQVLNLLAELQNEFGQSYLFIGHDLDVVRYVSQRIIVLYGGQVMEQGPAEAIYSSPSHPYTQMLLDAAPVPDPAVQRERRAARTASVPPPGSVRPRVTRDGGCPFAGRCPYAVEVCTSVRPPAEQTPAGTFVACHRWRETAGHTRQAALTTTTIPKS